MLHFTQIETPICLQWAPDWVGQLTGWRREGALTQILGMLSMVQRRMKLDYPYGWRKLLHMGSKFLNKSA
tara:strand:+ start:69779 stop:69988 length:210 start_codon:yes stop_codon:yes gene_type:complete